MLRPFDKAPKKYQRYLEAFNDLCLSNRTLSDVYVSPSSRKQTIWSEIERFMNLLKGQKLTVLYHNSQFFTAAFILHYSDLKKCADEGKYLRYLSAVKLLNKVDEQLIKAENYTGNEQVEVLVVFTPTQLFAIPVHSC